jgi:glycosyltransferase involved in cell wall biosynthesis
MSLVSLVLPCRNQADHIGDLLPRFVRALAATGVDFEVIAVPNNCRDRTPAIVAELACREPRLRVIPQEIGGWGRAVRAGLDAARGGVLAYTNAARTDPESLPAFFAEYHEHPTALVKARRILRQAPVREIGSLLYNLEARLLFGVGGDVNGTPKIFGADFYRGLRLSSTGDLLDLELMSQARVHGLPIREISVAGFKRHGGRSSTTLTSAWNMYFGALRLRLGISA